MYARVKIIVIIIKRRQSQDDGDSNTRVRSFRRPVIKFVKSENVLNNTTTPTHARVAQNGGGDLRVRVPTCVRRFGRQSRSRIIRAEIVSENEPKYPRIDPVPVDPLTHFTTPLVRDQPRRRTVRFVFFFRLQANIRKRRSNYTRRYVFFHRILSRLAATARRVRALTPNTKTNLVVVSLFFVSISGNDLTLARTRILRISFVTLFSVEAVRTRFVNNEVYPTYIRRPFGTFTVRFD